MKEAAKPPQSSAVVSDLKALFCPFRTRRTKVFLYGSAFAFVAFSAYLAFCPPEKTSPWFNSLFTSANVSTAPYRSQISSLVSYIFPNSSPPPSLENAAPSPDNMPADGGGAQQGGILGGNATSAAGGISGSNKTVEGVGVKKGGGLAAKNQTASEIGLPKSGVAEKNRPASGSGLQGGEDSMKNHTIKGGSGISTSDQGKDGVGSAKATTLTTKNQTTSGVGPPKSGDSPSKNQTKVEDGSTKDAILAAKNLTVTGVGSLKNGHLPVKNQTGKGVASKANPVPPNVGFPQLQRVPELLQRRIRKGLQDFNCSVEFFRSPFLVQEWEMPGSNGNKKETLRLDIIERSSAKYKDADVLVFNTGHWWTHEKTSKGKDYYQEGNHIYSDLNVVNAFHKALNTWAKWVDANVNSKNSLVFFRGYSVTHFSGGRWNSGGQCDKETEPIKNEKYLSSYPWKMTVLESVIKGMKTPVAYLNITTMTDYRKDAHPSIYRKQNLTEEERRSPERYQDCSHWCLPGVPDSWNELLYAQLIIKHHQLL
ncbi:hypothetical protein C4D60_Mb09t14340 [Musa balbisiana]|uniref:Trichome birefringence-like C-terminal domain-containing protein n=1 Tax=Musa balbisiana TaxID=52838 RepID=A0A4S8IH57_MUSBA|nr:hypothetical protein C4D60_Mb09t14340 [Musa balbisiana]